ncbi:MAG TPA: DinB family protein [Gammaproteobacteria bacterium]|jgi:uncharacterized damage-inducible protein DinB|nr:DinB family protein [Gammaproteobacteria bacterium]
MRIDHVRLMAAYNAWMNDRLYAVCSTLPDEERKRDRGAFFHSIHGTLNHLLLADRIWLGRFEGKPFAAKSLDQELHASFDALRTERVELDAHIRNWVHGLTEADLEATLRFRSIVSSAERSAPLWKLLVHFFNHQTHHRGQLTTLLSQAEVDYGVTDLMWLPGVLDE